MRLPKVTEFLLSLPYRRDSGSNIWVRCPFCGDSDKHEDSAHLSIKVDVEKGEPLVYQCMQSKCTAKGALRTDSLQALGCMDMDTIMELSEHNAHISKNFDKAFVTKTQRDYQLINLVNRDNAKKLEYVNRRLGMDFEMQNLREFKIQLSLYDMLNLNGIRKLSFSRKICDMLEAYTVGFVSMYKDYLICRDITPNLEMGRRYYMYRTSGVPDIEDMKIYSIPREISILSSEAAVINVAEGPFSIIGPYLHTDLGRERENSIWLANCGSEYLNTILHVCKQYGFLKVRINIWSDSEIKLKKYEKLYHDLTNRLRITKFTVFYNSAAEDFGQPKNKIKVDRVTIYEKD